MSQVDDVAYGDIQHKQSKLIVPDFDSASLHDFVPFYFAPRSPMLYVVTMTSRVGKKWPADDFVYLVTTAEHISDVGYRYTFTDGHPIVKISQFHNDLRDLDKVDWPVMSNRFWNDTPQDPDRERRRQAEFLVHGEVPWGSFNGLAVRTAAAQQKVFDLQKQYLKSNERISVELRPAWYY